MNVSSGDWKIQAQTLESRAKRCSIKNLLLPPLKITILQCTVDHTSAIYEENNNGNYLASVEESCVEVEKRVCTDSA
jgi:hypothetical protein